MEVSGFMEAVTSSCSRLRCYLQLTWKVEGKWYSEFNSQHGDWEVLESKVREAGSSLGLSPALVTKGMKLITH